MNLLELCYEYPPLGGGGGKVVQGLATNLIDLGYNIDVVTMKYNDLPKHEVSNEINIHRVPCLRASEELCHSYEMATYIAFAMPKLKKLFRSKKYILNHTHFIFPDGIISYFLKLQTGMPYVITAHGSDVPGYNPDRFKLQHTFLAPLWNTVVKNADCIICPSEIIESLVHKQRRDAKTFVIPNGLEIDKWNSSREKMKSILVVTRMFERKGVQYVLDALKGLSHDFEVNIVGDGPYLKVLRDLASKYSVDVKFWGWLDNDSPQLKELFETSRIFVFPSEAENFPIVLLEAMAARMAIVTTSGTGCAEVVGDSALLVKPKNSDDIRRALMTLINDPSLCKKLGDSSRNRLEENFGWKAVAKRYSDLFHQTMSSSHSTS